LGRFADVIGWFILLLILTLLDIDWRASIVLSSCFSLSSTAVSIKMLEERMETNSIHGEVMIAWLLVQDLAVVPVISVLSVLTFENRGMGWIGVLGGNLLLSLVVLTITYFLGKIVVRWVIHTVAAGNSRELMVLGGVSLALVTAYLVSLFGINAALGAFLRELF
jgi:CPA2 family monovalent cation:H+ antiporter-2